MEALQNFMSSRVYPTVYKVLSNEDLKKVKEDPFTYFDLEINKPSYNASF